jgi:hypothetical protein
MTHTPFNPTLKLALTLPQGIHEFGYRNRFPTLFDIPARQEHMLDRFLGSVNVNLSFFLFSSNCCPALLSLLHFLILGSFCSFLHPHAFLCSLLTTFLLISSSSCLPVFAILTTFLVISILLLSIIYVFVLFFSSRISCSSTPHAFSVRFFSCLSCSSP